MSRLRPIILTLALLAFSLRAQAQTALNLTSPPQSGSVEVQLLQWAVTQGGLVLVVLVVVWSYRRDFQRLFAAENGRTTELMLALQNASSALAAHAETMRDQASADREQAKAFVELAGSVKTCEAVREVFSERNAR
jgi:hypothetical protein